jgi:alkylhydroperoxidase family enzyme
VALTELFDTVTLSELERHLVLLIASHENGSHYCATVFSRSAAKNQVPADVIEAIRADMPLKDKKLETLRSFTANAVNCRGQISAKQIQDFLDSGYTRANILEIVLDISMATLTNYTNLIANTVLDKQFESAIHTTTH